MNVKALIAKLILIISLIGTSPADAAPAYANASLTKKIANAASSMVVGVALLMSSAMPAAADLKAADIGLAKMESVGLHYNFNNSRAAAYRPTSVTLAAALLETDNYALPRGHTYRYYRIGTFDGEMSFDTDDAFGFDDISVSNYRVRLLEAVAFDEDLSPSIGTTRATMLGFERIDRAADMGRQGNQQGYATEHLHLFGLYLPYNLASYELGYGDVGFGNFAQSQLQEWAGDGADFSYVFFHRVGVGLGHLDGQPMDDDFGFRVGLLFESSQGGKIKLPDHKEGNFRARGEKLYAEIIAEPFWHSHYGDIARLIVGGQVYWQHLHAELKGRDPLTLEDRQSKVYGKVMLIGYD